MESGTREGGVSPLLVSHTWTLLEPGPGLLTNPAAHLVLRGGNGLEVWHLLLRAPEPSPLCQASPEEVKEGPPSGLSPHQPLCRGTPAPLRGEGSCAYIGPLLSACSRRSEPGPRRHPARAGALHAAMLATPGLATTWPLATRTSASSKGSPGLPFCFSCRLASALSALKAFLPFPLS